MSLDKLAEQYERETGKPAFYAEFGWRERFVEWLANRPTCGHEQRRFLDEIERDWVYEDRPFTGMTLSYSSIDIPQSYIKSDLSKVIKGE